MRVCTSAKSFLYLLPQFNPSIPFHRHFLQRYFIPGSRLRPFWLSHQNLKISGHRNSSQSAVSGYFLPHKLGVWVEGASVFAVSETKQNETRSTLYNKLDGHVFTSRLLHTNVDRLL